MKMKNLNELKIYRRCKANPFTKNSDLHKAFALIPSSGYITVKDYKSKGGKLPLLTYMGECEDVCFE